MTETRDIGHPFVGNVDIDGRRYAVSVEVAFDGVEHVGHLLFADDDWDDGEEISDQLGIPGKTADDVVLSARHLSAGELAQRYRRALSTTRRNHGLRKATEEVLNHIRHLNKVSTSMRAGLLDVDDAAREIDATEQQLVSMVRQLKSFAGVTA
jgi:hypothetical protein